MAGKMFQLPSEVQRAIWSFDPTYKEEFKKVLHQIKFRFCMGELNSYDKYPFPFQYQAEWEFTKSGHMLFVIKREQDLAGGGFFIDPLRWFENKVSKESMLFEPMTDDEYETDDE